MLIAHPIEIIRIKVQDIEDHRLLICEFDQVSGSKDLVVLLIKLKESFICVGVTDRGRPFLSELHAKLILIVHREPVALDYFERGFSNISRTAKSSELEVYILVIKTWYGPFIEKAGNNERSVASIGLGGAVNPRSWKFSLRIS